MVLVSVVKTLFYERAQRVKCCSCLEEKMKFISPSHRVQFFFDFIGNVFSLYIGKLTNNSQKAGNDVINILNSEGLKNTPLGTRVEFLMNFFVEWYIFQ